MNPLPLKLHKFEEIENNFEIFIEEECLKSKFFENNELEFNLENVGKFKIKFKI